MDSVARDDDKYATAAKDFCGGNAFSREPPQVQLFALWRHIGFFAHLEHAIWVATHPGWLSLSLEPWLLYPGVASYEAGVPDCVRLHPHYDNGDDGYLSPFYAYQDYRTLIPTLILTVIFAQALALDFATLAMVSHVFSRPLYWFYQTVPSLFS